MSGDQKTGALTQAPFKPNLMLVVSDPDIPDGPSKESKRVDAGDIRPKLLDWDPATTPAMPGTAKTGDFLKATSSATVAGIAFTNGDMAYIVNVTGPILQHIPKKVNGIVLNAANTPMNVQLGQTIYVDTSAGPVEAVLPAGVTTDASIKLIPLAATYSTNPMTLRRNGDKIGGFAEDVEVTENNLSIDMRHIDSTYGWAAISGGTTFVQQTVNINASDLVQIREVAGSPVTILTSDREGAIATTSNTAGNIILPSSTGLTAGWQCTVVQYGDGAMTFQTDAGTPGDSIIAFSGQTTTLGKGVFVSIILFPGGVWLVGGGLTGV